MDLSVPGSSRALEDAAYSGAYVYLQLRKDRHRITSNVEVRSVQIAQHPWLDRLSIQLLDPEPRPHDRVSDKAASQRGACRTGQIVLGREPGCAVGTDPADFETSTGAGWGTGSTVSTQCEDVHRAVARRQPRWTVRGRHELRAYVARPTRQPESFRDRCEVSKQFVQLREHSASVASLAGSDHDEPALLALSVAVSDAPTVKPWLLRALRCRSRGPRSA